jgi:hypothetical protein
MVVALTSDRGSDIILHLLPDSDLASITKLAELARVL